MGNYFTSLEMMGVTVVTIMKLDKELKTLISLEAELVGFNQLNFTAFFHHYSLIIPI